ncbi:DUF1559 family PulG-like putative transporter [Allorhodopirellula solitaria]|uniref:DUF1559 domain-containing protein n=1 Tax=Allorhodopirellula solitaria TaxID=2527987 RepID=A0A5C5YJX4_9BACT|nr:DUF1559 domain-containing protein [Allorhodopirellula solitaria]TWT75119.1 hypothetical protein CA85_04080 [Allorhodopirellula solitaria]
MKSHHNQRAFTKLEVVVVIACVVILLGLLLPNMGGNGRIYARRNQCSTQLKNLSLAVIQHEVTKKRIPSWAEDFGTFGLDGAMSDPSDSQVAPSSLVKHRKIGTWAVAILPWLDGQPTYEVWSEDRNPVVSGGSRENPLSSGVSGEGYCHNAAPSLAIFRCPSTDRSDIEHGFNSYIANTGMAFPINADSNQTRLMHTPGGQSQSVSFVDSLLPRYGVFNSRLDARVPGAVDAAKRSPVGPVIRLDDFTDGYGNTVLFSESLSALPWHRSGFTDQSDLEFQDAPKEVAYPKFSRFTNGLVWHSVDWENGGKDRPVHRINGPLVGVSLSARMVTSANAANLARPSSNHPSGVNVAFADGGTRYISDTIDMQVWQALLTPAGDEPIDEDRVP